MPSRSLARLVAALALACASSRPALEIELDPEDEWRVADRQLTAAVDPVDPTTYARFRVGRGGCGREIGLYADPLPVEPTIEICLKATREEPEARVVILDRDLGRGDAAWARLREELLRIRELAPEAPATFRAWPGVRAADVERLLAMLEEGGYARPGLWTGPGEMDDDLIRRLLAADGREKLLARAIAAMHAFGPIAFGRGARVAGALGEPAFRPILESLSRTGEADSFAIDAHLRALAALRREDGSPVDLSPALPAILAAIPRMCCGYHGGLDVAFGIARRIGPEAEAAVERAAREAGLDRGWSSR